MTLSKNLKNRGLKLAASLIIILTLLGGVKLGVETSAAHAAPVHHLLACGGDAFPPCE